MLRRQFRQTKIFSLSFNQILNIFDNKDKLIGVCVKKAFKLREDIRVFADEAQTKELLRIQTPEILDFSATYNIYDSASNNLLGYWRRQGLQSILRDSWVMLDSESASEVGKMEEDNMTMAVIRRFCPFGHLIPQTYYLKNNSGTTLASFIQDFNPFFYGLKVKIYQNSGELIDLKMAMAGAMLLATIEGRQQQ